MLDLPRKIFFMKKKRTVLIFFIQGNVEDCHIVLAIYWHPLRFSHAKTVVDAGKGAFRDDLLRGRGVFKKFM